MKSNLSVGKWKKSKIPHPCRCSIIIFNSDTVLRSYMLLPSFLTGFWEDTYSRITFNSDKVLISYMFQYLHSWQGFEKIHVPLPSFLTGFWEGMYMFCYRQSWQGFEKIHVLLHSILTGFWEDTCSVTFNPDRVLRSYMFHNYLQFWQSFEKLQAVTFNPDRVLRKYIFQNYVQFRQGFYLISYMFCYLQFC